MAPAKSKSESGIAVKTASRASAPATDEKQVESLERENEELRRISQYRSLFLTRLAHELRTPLTSILGFSEILLNQEKLTEAQRSFCERIQSSSQQLQSSLNQLSDLARLEAGQTQVVAERILLAEAIAETLPALSRRAEKKKLHLNCDVPDSLPALISDRGRLRQVIYNLLAYAISRSPENQAISVRAETTVDGLMLTIHDNGDPLANPSEIGILDSSNEAAGTGELGLAIARQNIQMLGGTINASNSDRGLEVRIDLPLNPPQN
jgi:two-component system phosphate regulon sensor histidine kinase PhoR